MQSVPLLSGHVRGPHLALPSPNSCRPLARWLSCSESSWVLSFRVRVWLRAPPPPPVEVKVRQGAHCQGS